ncbi:MAG: homoserine O-acetyltransferase family protein [Chitinophagales bacterium]
MPLQTFRYFNEFPLESGASFPELQISYHTYGTMNADKSNVIWICHALTANSDVADWWEGLFGEGKVLDPTKSFIVCANMLGSCYGTTSPISIKPKTQKAYYSDFPLITIRDIVNAHILLRKHLGIDKIQLGSGGSMGCQQLLEWAIMEPSLFENIFLIAGNHRHSPWGIAFNESQRLAIEADSTFGEARPGAGAKGLKAARSIGILSYRHYEAFWKTQLDNDEKMDNYKASSYQIYQGNKLVERFDAYSYWTLSKAMDSHNIARNRGNAVEVLQGIKARALVVSISSDWLFPPQEQRFLHQHIPNSDYYEIESFYGHDGFLVEYEKINSLVVRFLNSVVVS